MTTLQWSEDMGVEMAQMDATHQECVALLQAVQGADDARLMAAWERLLAHTEAHFAEEDRWMQAAGVRLHLVVSRRGDTDSLFTGERLRAQVPDWLQADVWFCGPANFGDALQQDLVAHGLAPGHFQRELFEMR